MLIYRGVMMLDELAEVKYFEDGRKAKAELEAHYKKMRNIWILNAYISGNRQCVIGNACGLSESTVKHIIAAEKKRIKS